MRHVSWGYGNANVDGPHDRSSSSLAGGELLGDSVMSPATNGLLQKVLTGLVLTAILAGGSALITQAQLKTEVKSNSEAVAKAMDTQIKIREDLAVVKVKVSSVEKAVEKNGDKLDKILERLPSKK